MGRGTLFGIILGGVLLAQNGIRAAESQDSNRQPASADEPQVFTQEYLDRINTNNQAKQEEEKQARERHQRVLDWYTKFR